MTRGKFEVEWHKDKRGLTFHKFYSGIGMLIHMERLAGTRVVSKYAWMLTDDFVGYFSYEGYRFVVETPFAEVELRADSADVPTPILKAVLDHALAYKPPGFLAKMQARLRYFPLPVMPKNTRDVATGDTSDS